MLEQNEYKIRAKKTRVKYPHRKVTVFYSLLGGLIGSLMLCIISLFGVGSRIGIGLDMDFLTLIFILAAGTIYGTIPAFFTGAIVSYNEIRISGWDEYFYIGAIGFLPSFTTFAAISSEFGFGFLMGAVGGISAIIVAKLIVPKVGVSYVRKSSLRG